MTKRRVDWDAGVGGSFKLKRHNEDRVSLIMSDKLSVAAGSAPASLGMEEKALKAVDFNRQVAVLFKTFLSSSRTEGTDEQERVCPRLAFPACAYS